MIRDSTGKELNGRNIVSVSQLGFEENRSCQTNPISLFVGITSLIERGNCVDVIY